MEPTSKIEIKLDETRSQLGEGRSKGIGLAFLKNMGEGKFEAVQPVSPCKDYLNDVIYVERTAVKEFSACGLHVTKRDIFDTHGYLVAQSCHHHNGSAYVRFDEEVKLLTENRANTQKMLNDIEEMFKLKDRTELVAVDKNLIFCKVPIEWTESSWMISLWGFIHRNAIYAKGGHALEELAQIHTGDASYIPGVIARIKKIVEKGIPKQTPHEWPDVHSYGILACPKLK